MIPKGSIAEISKNICKCRWVQFQKGFSHVCYSHHYYSWAYWKLKQQLLRLKLIQERIFRVLETCLKSSKVC